MKNGFGYVVTWFPYGEPVEGSYQENSVRVEHIALV